MLLYDEFDIWEVKPDGGAPRNITGGEGRKPRIAFRYRSIDPEERAVPANKPLLLSATDDRTRATGFYRLPSLTVDRGAQKVVMLDKAFGAVNKAKNADTVVFTLSRFDEFPDLWISDTTFKDMKKVSDVGTQQNAFVWGKSELIDYINADGKKLRAILIKPENFDPTKKYPLMVYIYEELSQGLHSFSRAERRHQHQHPALRQQRLRGAASRHRLHDRVSGRSGGEVRHPGDQHGRGAGLHRSEADRHPGALVGRLPDRVPDHADEPVRGGGGGRVGVEHDQRLRRHPLGHRACRAQFQYEKTQSRIGAPPWEAPLQFIENSPIFWVEKVQTPYLMIHNDEDDAVPWYQGIEFITALRRLGKEGYMFNYNGELHGLRNRDNQKH